MPVPDGGARPPRILFVQFANPGSYPPIAHAAHILAEGGAQVWILGTRPRIGGDIELRPHPGIRVTSIPEGQGLRMKVSFLWFSFLAVWLALRFRPSWLYVSDLFATPAGVASALITGVPVVYHEHDVHTEQAPSIFVRACQAARRKLASAARCVVVPSEGRAQHVRESLGIDSLVVVMNCPRRDDVRAARGSGDESLRLVYQGTIVAQRLPLQLADAIAQMNGRVTLTLAGYEPAGAEGHIARLIERATQRGHASIDYAGLLTSRAALLDFCASFDVGVALVPRGGDVNMRTMAGASNKAFDYLACGLPLLVTDDEGWRDMFVAPGYAVAVRPDDERELVAALVWLIGHRERLREMGAAGQARIVDEWNYEHQFAPLRALLMGGQSLPPSRQRA